MKYLLLGKNGLKMAGYTSQNLIKVWRLIPLFLSPSPSSFRNDWSTKGCTVVGFNETHTTCECNHLTTYGVLVDTSKPQVRANKPATFSIVILASVSVLLFCLLFHHRALRVFPRFSSNLSLNSCYIAVPAKAGFFLLNLQGEAN